MLHDGVLMTIKCHVDTKFRVLGGHGEVSISIIDVSTFGVSFDRLTAGVVHMYGCYGDQCSLQK